MVSERPSLAELSQAYPNLSVLRDRTGDIVVANNSNHTRTTLFLRRGDQKQLVPDVGLTVRYYPGFREYGVPKDMTQIIVRPQSPLDSIADVRKRDIDVDPKDVIADARHGLEIFDAMLHTDRSTRLVMQPVAYDHLQEEDILIWVGLQNVKEDPSTEEPSDEVLNSLRALGLTKWDMNPSPVAMHDTMRRIVSRSFTLGTVEDSPAT